MTSLSPSLLPSPPLKRGRTTSSSPLVPALTPPLKPPAPGPHGKPTVPHASALHGRVVRVDGSRVTGRLTYSADLYTRDELDPSPTQSPWSVEFDDGTLSIVHLATDDLSPYVNQVVLENEAAASTSPRFRVEARYKRKALYYPALARANGDGTFDLECVWGGAGREASKARAPRRVTPRPASERTPPHLQYRDPPTTMPTSVPLC